MKAASTKAGFMLHLMKNTLHSLHQKAMISGRKEIKSASDNGVVGATFVDFLRIK